MPDATNRWSLTALALLAAIAPFNVKVTSEAWSDLQLRLLIVVALVVTVSLTVRALATPPIRWPDTIDMLAYVWLVAVWVSALTSDDRVLGAGGAARLSVAILLIPVTRAVVDSSADKRHVLQALALGTLAGSVVGLGIWLWGAEFDATRAFVGQVTRLGPFNRLTRPWAHANVAAMAMGAAGATVMTLSNRWLRRAGLVVVTVALVLTISRGGLIAAGGAAVAWVVLRRRRSEVVGAIMLGLIGLAVFLSSSAWTTRVEQLGDEAFYASSLEPPVEIIVGPSGELVEVTVTNLSATTWNRAGDERVLISARWIGSDDMIWSEDWWQLPDDLAAGEQLTAALTVDSRVPDGDYEVRWDLIIPGTAYFGQFLGEPPIISSAEVIESDVRVDQIFRYDLVERSIGIGRIDGWKLAWRDFTSAPLLGVGPNQFADRAMRSLESTQRVAGGHAHNIVLEPLATWGLFGTLPFLALGVIALARALSTAWRSRELIATVIATGLVALLLHGLVDWPLVVITTGIPVGILAGLALADPNHLGATGPDRDA